VLVENLAAAYEMPPYAPPSRGIFTVNMRFFVKVKESKG
jgi:hypothetical protein